MVIKKITKLCREQRALESMNYGGDLWVGTGFALYSLGALPEMSVEQVATMFDYNEKTKKNMVLREATNWKVVIDKDDDYGSQFSENPEKAVVSNMDVYVFRKGSEVIMCNADLFAPFEDLEEETGLFYYLRRMMVQNEMYDIIAVKAGFTLVGLVLPIRILPEQLEAWIARQQQLLLDVQAQLDKVKALAAADEEDDEDQMTM